MTEELQLQVAKLVDKEEEIKKLNAWGNFGTQLYHTELAFQITVQQILNKLVDPSASTELIPQAEQALATVKKDLQLHQEERLKLTARFDTVKERLMKPEKQIQAAIKITEGHILTAKQKLKEQAQTQENKNKELRQIAEQVRIYVADMHASYLEAQLKLLNNAYEYALQSNVTVDAMPEYISKVCARVNLQNMVTPVPKPAFKYNTQEAVNACVMQHFNPWPALEYVEGFARDVKTKFADWDLALKNPEQAKKLNTQEVVTTAEAIQEQKDKETVSAKLEALSAPVAETTGIKPLKQVWKLAEPQTIEEAFAIINAFAINRNLVTAQLTRIKPANIGVKQMIAALEAIKADDEAFECTGLTFTKNDKL